MNRITVLVLILVLMADVGWGQHKTEHLFYYTDSNESWESLNQNIDKISIVAPGAFSVDEDGIVWGAVDQRIVELAKKHGVGVMPLIVNPGFDQLMLHKLLINPDARARAIASLIEQCERYKLLGIQFDFENLNMGDKDGFTRFYKETADALHKKGFKLSVAVVHRPEEYAGTTAYHKWLFENWRAGYDLKELAAAGDFISVMTYSQHTRRTTPGPNAGIPWMTQIAEYFLKFMPPEKLSLGIPTGSMHWYTALDTVRYFANARSWSNSIDYTAAMGLADRNKAKVQWNEGQQVPYTIFENAGLFEYIFFENARSFKAKYDLMKKYKLRGFSVWVLGSEDPELWKLLPNAAR